MSNSYGGSNAGKAGIRIRETDGSPDVAGVSDIIVSDGSLTDNGNGSVSIDTGGGGGTPGGSDTQVQFNNAGAFGGDAGLTFNATTDKLTVGGEIEIDGDLNHDGSNLGVFGTAPTTQQPTTAYSPSPIPGSPTGSQLDLPTATAIDTELGNIQASLQSIIDLLKSYGLSS